MQIAKSEYRKINKLSASDIKLFNENRYKFYVTKVLGEKQEDLTSPAIVLGTLVDFILSDCRGSLDEFDKRFDEKFKLLSIKKGSGQMFLLVDELFKFTLRDMDEEGNITSSFSTRFEEAFDKLQSQDKFKGKKVEWALEQFRNSDEEIYFQECLDSIGKYVVDTWMLENAKRIVENVSNDENVGYLFKPKDNIINFGKYVIEWEYMGIEMKSELDDFSIDLQNKKAIITEIKTNWDISNFHKVYLKLGYYLAAAFYYKAVEYYLNMNNYKDFSIEFQFLSIDSSPTKLRPIIYTLNEQDINNAINGFSTVYDNYLGLDYLIKEIIWCQKEQIWNINKFTYENNSKIPLKVLYL